MFELSSLDSEPNHIELVVDPLVCWGLVQRVLRDGRVVESVRPFYLGEDMVVEFPDCNEEFVCLLAPGQEIDANVRERGLWTKSYRLEMQKDRREQEEERDTAHDSTTT